MKKLLLIAFICLSGTFASAQTIMYVDSLLTTPALAYAYQMSAAPTIDGDATEWADIPWTEAFFNDRDRNNDGLIDPFVDQHDLQAKYKVAWLDGGHTLYMLVSFSDNAWFPLSENATSDVYNCDGFELRLDPLNVKAEGETGDNSVHYIILEYGKTEAISMSAFTTAETYKAAWAVDKESFPKTAVLELELTLQSTLALTPEYVMGIYPYFNDNDGAPGKVSAAVLWPQMWSAIDGQRVGVDQAWEHTWRWGEVKCVAQTVHTVSGNLQATLDAAAEGDIIKLGAGTYTGNFTITTPGLTLLGEGAVLSPSDNAQPVLWVKPGAYNVKIQGLKFQGNLSDGSPVSVGGLKLEAGVAKILNNEFVDFNDKAIECVMNEGANIIENNQIYNVANTAIIVNDVPFTAVRYNQIEKGATKIQAKVNSNQRGSLMDIAYNKISDFLSGSVGISYGVTGSNVSPKYTWTIHHNYIYVPSAQRVQGGYDFGDNCVENQESNLGGSVSYIYNNTFAFIKNASIQMNGPTPNKFYLKNNISAWNSRQREKNMTDYDIRNKPTDADPPTITIDHSLSITDIQSHRYIIMEAPFNEAANMNIVADPAFADTLTDNYELTSGSPAIDQGEASPFGFQFAYAGSAPDLGAFEYGMPKPTHVAKRHDDPVATNFRLKQNYPNPFNPATLIQYTIPEAGLVTLKIYNVMGQEITTLVNKVQTAGGYSVQFDAVGLSSGVYFYTLTTGNFTISKKMLLMR